MKAHIFKSYRFVLAVLCLLAICAAMVPARAGVLFVPNNSFESPASVYAPGMDYWQETAQPANYDYPNSYPWYVNVGQFYNNPGYGPGVYITNCDGTEAGYLFEDQGVGIFQDYNSLNGTNPVPSHQFNAIYKSGNSYTMTVGLIGAGGNMTEGAPLQLIFYYRDSSNNMVTVASTTVTNSTNTFVTRDHFMDFSVHVPNVKSTNAWAGKNIGIEILSTVSQANEGGYWDLDNVRLVEGIDVPNYSFESPVISQFSPGQAYWQETPQPSSYDYANGYPWYVNVGQFYNDPDYGPGVYITNGDGSQAGYLFEDQGVGFFQDYISNLGEGTNAAASDPFNSTYEIGKSYMLTVGLIGAGGNMVEGAPLQLILYYRDSSSNLITVASTTVTNSTNIFVTRDHFIDYKVQIPAVKASDPWAGQYIGIEFLSTVSQANEGGYWDLDNVRLTEAAAPTLSNFSRTNGQFTFNVRSEPGLAFEIQATTNLSTTNWVSLGSFTNTNGNASFTNTTGLTQRFYRAHQL